MDEGDTKQNSDGSEKAAKDNAVQHYDENEEWIEDHTGIKQTAPWPWPPSSCFHDDHHKHFHLNYGQCDARRHLWEGYTYRRARRYHYNGANCHHGA